MTDEAALIARYSVVLAVAWVLQVAMLNDFRIGEVRPELLLLVALCAAVVGGATRGAIVGFAAGCLADLFLAGRFGVSALSYALVAYGTGVVADTIIRPARWISVTLITLASAAGVLAYAALAQLLGQSTLSDPRLGWIVGIVAVINGALSLPTLAVCRWADHHDPVRARLH